MVKVKIGKQVYEFTDETSAARFIVEFAGDKEVSYQYFVYNTAGALDSMDYLTYRQGRTRESYSTAK